MIIAVCLLVGSFAASCALYLLRIRFAPEARLSFNGEGIFDGMSVIQLGAIHREQLKKVRLVTTFFLGSCLEITLRSTASVWSKETDPLRLILKKIYQLLFSSRLYVPISILDASREQIKEKIRQLNELPKESVASDAIQRLRQERDSIVPKEGEPPPLPAKAGSPREVTVDEPIPLEMDSTLPERDPQANEVGRRAFKYFNEKVLHLPEWQKSQPHRVPAGLQNISYEVTKGREKISFLLGEVSFEFSLDLEGSEEFVTLSVFIQGEETLVVLLHREIGGFEYMECQRFKQGEWLGQLEALFDGPALFAARA